MFNMLVLKWLDSTFANNYYYSRNVYQYHHGFNIHFWNELYLNNKAATSNMTIDYAFRKDGREYFNQENQKKLFL